MDRIKLGINHEKLAEQGWSFEDWSDIYSYISGLVDWLERAALPTTKITQKNNIIRLLF